MSDQFKISEDFQLKVSRWKLHYGLRPIGTTEDNKTVISGLDVYKLSSSVGVDLEMVLLFLNQRSCTVDWVSYVKAATVEGWLINTIIKKLSYPITEVFGERYWLQVKVRIMAWFIEHMKEQNE